MAKRNKRDRGLGPGDARRAARLASLAQIHSALGVGSCGVMEAANARGRGARIEITAAVGVTRVDVVLALLLVVRSRRLVPDASGPEGNLQS